MTTLATLSPHTETVLDRAGVRHGFFDRQGGVSDGIYASLNAGPGSRDDPRAVAENHRRIADALKVDTDHLVAMHQTHSTDVVILKDAPRERPRVDGVATRERGLALMVLTADCAPVLLADPENRIIGAAHAGWRGGLGGILMKTVAAMEDLGAQRHRIVAAIGPTIGPKSYEVGPEFVEPMVQVEPEALNLFTPAQRPGHHLFDLPGFLRLRLAHCGVETVADSGLDTFADETRWFSYRRATHRNEADYGRLASVIVLPA